MTYGKELCMDRTILLFIAAGTTGEHSSRRCSTLEVLVTALQLFVDLFRSE
jgi:hypothetical protein